MTHREPAGTEPSERAAVVLPPVAPTPPRPAPAPTLLAPMSTPERVALLDALGSITGCLVWSSDEDGSPDYVSASWCSYTGLTAQGVFETGICGLMPAEERDAILARWEAAKCVHQPLEAEFRYRRHDGEYRWFLGRITPITDAQGRLHRWVGTMTDIHARKLAEDRLRESEAMMRTAFANAAIGFALTTPDGRFVEVNDAYCRLSGYTVEELRGRTFREMVHPDDVAANVELNRALEAGETPGFVVENRYVRKDGRAVWVRKSVSMVRGEDGAPQWTIALIEDITARKLAEEELLLSEERYRSLVAATTAIVWTADPEGRFVEPQPSWEAYTGQPWEEHCGLGWLDVVREEDRADLMERWSRASQAKATYEAGGRLWHAASGEHRYFVVRAVPLLDAAGGVREWIGTVADADAKRRADRERDEALSLLDTLLKGVPVGFAFIDTDLRFRLVNRALAEINGLPAEAHIGRSVHEVVPELAAQGESIIRQVMETGQPVVNRAVTGEAPGAPGVRRSWLENWYPVAGSDGSCLGVGAVVVDVTEMRRAQMEIANLNQRLHRAVYESSHRLKNHLQTLAASIDIILMESEENISPEQVQRLGTQVRMLAGIHDLVTMATKAEADADTLSARVLLSRVISALPRATGLGRLGLEVEDVPLSMRHAAALALIVNEAVSNGQKHGHGAIEVTFRAEDGQGVLVVRDNGPGFPQDFDPRRDANTGLELVAALVNSDLQGDLACENAPEGGARVVVTFPLPRQRTAPV